MIIKDMQPFSIVEDGFRELVAALELSYQLPSRSMLSRKLLPEMYDSILQNQKQCTSLTTESYITVIINFITDTWERFSGVFERFEYSDRHTADDLAAELKRAASECELSNKLTAIVTDNAHNISAAVETTDMDSFAMSLQAQIRPDAVPLKLINDVVARWNSTFYMFQRIYEVQEFVEAVLGILYNLAKALSVEWAMIRNNAVSEAIRTGHCGAKLRERHIGIKEDVNTVGCNARPNSDTNFDIWQDFDSRLEHVKVTPSAAMVELRQYVSEPIIARKEHSLVWWKTRQLVCLGSSQLAKKN
ncbi:hypothetical protein PR048_011504 [Dryococelus australis]|uniref:Transposase n=1 Tax=Dryococelus australis TaxID=614101 RepID=A0ABQ9HM45_9NEOP|nr:hypothetical protein PR048_011504 [Dryococelus australis]